MSEQPVILRVALFLPLYQLFDYRPPPAGAAPGTLLWLTFKGVNRLGVVVAHVDAPDCPPNKLIAAKAALGRLFNEEQLALGRWLADYCLQPIGEVLAAIAPCALPASPAQTLAFAMLCAGPKSEDRLRRVGVKLKVLSELSARGLVKPARLDEQCLGWQLSAAGRALPVDCPLPAAPVQSRVCAALRAGPCGVQTLRRAGADKRVLQALQDKGLLEPASAIEEVSAWRLAEDAPLATEDFPGCETEFQPLPVFSERALPAMTPELQHMAAVDWGAGYACHLFEGLEERERLAVYLQLIKEACARKLQCLILSPNAPQLARALAPWLCGETGFALAGLGLWRRPAGAVAVFGGPEAVFAPLPRLGLVIVDEEHDHRYRQRHGPWGARYSARDVAVMRALLRKIPVALVSATPSFESIHNALQGRYRLSALPRPLESVPRVKLIDLNRDMPRNGLSTALLAALSTRLEQGGRALLFVSRREYARLAQCRACGWHALCPRCEVSLAFLSPPEILKCYYCGDERALPAICPHCAASAVELLGAGAQQIESSLSKAFPHIVVARFEEDKEMNKDVALTEAERAQRLRDAQIIVASSMPSSWDPLGRVDLIAFVDADSAVARGDFRGPERLAQTVGQLVSWQLACGLGADQGRPLVWVQGRQSLAPLFESLGVHGYNVCARNMLRERRRLSLPPYSFRARVQFECSQRDAALVFAARLRAAALRAPGSSAQGRVVGPLSDWPAYRAERFRFFLLLGASQRKVVRGLLTAAVAEARKACPKDLMWAVDADL